MGPVKQAEVLALVAPDCGGVPPEWVWEVLDAVDAAAGGLPAERLVMLLRGTREWRTAFSS